MPRWKPGQFPEGPPENYNPEDPYADPVALVEHREYNVRQKAIQVERAKVNTEVTSSLVKGLHSMQRSSLL